MDRRLPLFQQLLSLIARLPWLARRGPGQNGIADSDSGLNLASMSGAELEMLIAESFRRQGFTVSHSVSGRPDGEWDLVLKKQGFMSLVQCKHWRLRSVGLKAVRDLYGVMALHRADGGYLVTGGSFTPEAISYAADVRVELIDGIRLSAIIFDVERPERAHSTPSGARFEIVRNRASGPPAPECPQCGEAMVRRTAKRRRAAGTGFWSCSASPACSGTRVDWAGERRRAG
jgi:restriction system protein